jgi:hypothetical protein
MRQEPAALRDFRSILCRLWVTGGNARVEEIRSAVPQKADGHCVRKKFAVGPAGDIVALSTEVRLTAAGGHRYSATLEGRPSLEGTAPSRGPRAHAALPGAGKVPVTRSCRRDDRWPYTAQESATPQSEKLWNRGGRFGCRTSPNLLIVLRTRTPSRGTISSPRFTPSRRHS